MIKEYISLYGEKKLLISSSPIATSQVVKGCVIAEFSEQSLSFNVRSDISDCTPVNIDAVQYILNNISKEDSISLGFDELHLEFILDICHTKFFINDSHSLLCIFKAGARTNEMVELENLSKDHSLFTQRYEINKTKELANMLQHWVFGLTDNVAESVAFRNSYFLGDKFFYGWPNRVFVNQFLGCKNQKIAS